MTKAAFWIAITGLILSVVSLTWHVVSWRYTGALVKVDIARGFMAYPDGRTRLAVLIAARNVGRAPVSILGWGLQLPDKNQLVMTELAPWMSPPLPATVEGGHAADFRWPEDMLVPSLMEHRGRPDADLRAYVNLATGKKIHSKVLRFRPAS